MKFNFNRLLSDTHSSVEEETIDRWRRAAMKPGAPLGEEEVFGDIDDPSWFEKLPQKHENATHEKIELRSPVVRSNVAVRSEAPQISTPRMMQRTTQRPLQSSAAPAQLAPQASAPQMAPVPIQEPERAVRLLPGNPNFSIEDDMKQRFGARLRAALGTGTVIHGKLTFDTPVRIDGKLTGEVISSSTLVVGEAGNIKADVKVSSLVVYGKVLGPVHAKDLVEIKNGGRLEGDITTQRLVIDEGGYFDGDCVIQIVN